MSRPATWVRLAPQAADQYSLLLAAAGHRCTCSGDRCGQHHQTGRAHQGDRCQETGTAREPLLAVPDQAGALAVLCQGCARRREHRRAAASAAEAAGEALPLF